MAQALHEAKEERATLTLNIKGLRCPMPLTWAKKQLDSLSPGQTLEILATDPATVQNFESFARTTGHELVNWDEHDGVIRLLLRKAG